MAGKPKLINARDISARLRRGGFAVHTLRPQYQGLRVNEWFKGVVVMAGYDNDARAADMAREVEGFLKGQGFTVGSVDDGSCTVFVDDVARVRR